MAPPTKKTKSEKLTTPDRPIATPTDTTKSKTHLIVDANAIEKAKAHIIVEILEYVPNAVVSKTILKKTTGNVTVSSFDAGEELDEKTSPFDIYIQIIDGTADLEINKVKHILKLGQGFIIPAHSTHCFYASEKFKMISTIIKSGYED